MSDYAWIITRDHLADEGEQGDAGITGPSGAPGELVAQLDAGKGYTFRLYDGDGILYYTGRQVTKGRMGGERLCYAPLGDFGMGWAGCTSVCWQGHPEWDCE
jgi:hypothetical protein